MKNPWSLEVNVPIECVLGEPHEYVYQQLDYVDKYLDDNFGHHDEDYIEELELLVGILQEEARRGETNRKCMEVSHAACAVSTDAYLSRASTHSI